MTGSGTIDITTTLTVPAGVTLTGGSTDILQVDPAFSTTAIVPATSLVMGRNYYPVVYLKGDGSAINGITINGTTPAGGANLYDGIYADTGSVTITSVAVENIKMFSSSNQGSGIVIVDPASATITGSSIITIQKNGIDFASTGTLTATNNYIIGPGPYTTVAQNGIMVRDGTANISGGYITGMQDTTTQSACIAAIGGTVNVYSGTLTDCDTGLQSDNSWTGITNGQTPVVNYALPPDLTISTDGSVTGGDVITNDNGTAAPFGTSNPAIMNVALVGGTDTYIADGSSADSIVATITDANGNPIAGVSVSLTVDAIGFASACVTGGDGICGIQVTSTTAGTFAVTIVSPVGTTVTTTPSPLTVTFVAGPAVAGTLSVTPSVTAGDTATITLTGLADASGNPVANQSVTFALPDGTTTTCTTDSSGDCTATTTALTTAGPYTVSITDPATSALSASGTVVAGPAASGTLSVAPSSVTAGSPATITLTGLADADGNPVANQVVTFTVTLADGTTTTATCTTDASGDCTATTPALTSTGPFTVSITDPAISSPPSASGTVANSSQNVGPTPGAAIPTPALDSWMLALLAGLLAGVSIRARRKAL
jgi:adhesin/invasin